MISLNAITGFVVMFLGFLVFVGFVFWVDEKY